MIKQTCFVFLTVVIKDTIWIVALKEKYCMVIISEHYETKSSPSKLNRK